MKLGFFIIFLTTSLLGNEIGEDSFFSAEQFAVQELAKQYQTSMALAVNLYNNQTKAGKLADLVNSTESFHFLKSHLNSFNNRKIAREKKYFTFSYPGVEVKFNSFTVIGQFILINGKKTRFTGDSLKDFKSLEKALKTSKAVSLDFFMSNAYADEKDFEHHIMLSVLSLNLALEQVDHPLIGHYCLRCNWKEQVKRNLRKLKDKIAGLADECEAHSNSGSFFHHGLDALDNGLGQFYQAMLSLTGFSEDRSGQFNQVINEQIDENLNNRLYRTFQEFNSREIDGRPLLTCDKMIRMISESQSRNGSIMETNLFHSGRKDHRAHPLNRNFGGLADHFRSRAQDEENSSEVQRQCNQNYDRLERCLLQKSAAANQINNSLDPDGKDSAGGYQLDEAGTVLNN